MGTVTGRINKPYYDKYFGANYNTNLGNNLGDFGQYAYYYRCTEQQTQLGQMPCYSSPCQPTTTPVYAMPQQQQQATAPMCPTTTTATATTCAPATQQYQPMMLTGCASNTNKCCSSVDQSTATASASDSQSTLASNGSTLLSFLPKPEKYCVNSQTQTAKKHNNKIAKEKPQEQKKHDVADHNAFIIEAYSKMIGKFQMEIMGLLMNTMDECSMKAVDELNSIFTLTNNTAISEEKIAYVRNWRKRSLQAYKKHEHVAAGPNARKMTPNTSAKKRTATKCQLA